MTMLIAVGLVTALFLVGMLGAAAGLQWVFGVALPYLAVGMFVIGLAARVLRWANVPVPFRIPTTCGQQRSLAWIRPQRLENPPDTPSVIGRMALEILGFRSLLRNTKTVMIDGRRLTYATDLALWAGAIVMHWAMLIALIRHLRLMTNPVPGFVTLVERFDGFFEVGMPVIYLTSVAFLGALAYLLYRRLAIPEVRYISLVGDYFPLFLLLAIGGSGFWLRHVTTTDIASVKALVLGLTHFAPTVPASISPLFFGHLFLVSVLLAYFPFSKLLHMPGVFLSPTRNLANTTRISRHVNPWDYPVKVHTYAEYEDELRDKMIGAGLPVEKD
ncbi:MAG: sulfate reduction electron transfer complex DsrMKJOP subunit DsrM [Gemmatimonadota bacterium]|nr:sulfate reduction electron transfer complex DsrMKJOP subunit DsrM [Gemmatimonadota bacterium]MDH4351423.1 sulfate reduction electron transfer complex DsrMKJOP subunit DsrM [Gemmatimonadota bacterium]MDH5198065.1 sulfate reduction electron transfer complex DsrMKJOP subunit DsrM [Gemmatimonadota bacterium]